MKKPHKSLFVWFAILPLLSDLARLPAGLMACSWVAVFYLLCRSVFSGLQWLFPPKSIPWAVLAVLGVSAVFAYDFLKISFFWILSAWILLDENESWLKFAGARERLWKSPYEEAFQRALVFWAVGVCLCAAGHGLGTLAGIPFFQKPAGLFMMAALMAWLLDSKLFIRWQENPSGDVS